MGEKILKNNMPLAAVIAAVALLYAGVLAKLGADWWSDENYSHGLLVPFVIGLIVWKEWDVLKSFVTGARPWVGGLAVSAGVLLLLAGVLGAELFMQRISLAVVASGVLVYLFGAAVVLRLAVPFALLLLAIPIPQIIFNRIAFPLQVWASQMAVWGIRFFDVPTLRKGNVIDILARGATQTISLEVVEACSGIRSLMTLVTLGLILAYFTRRDEDGRFAGFSAADLVRAILLMIAAVPIAVITNAARVTGAGVLTYYYGKQATESAWHDASGWLVYVAALGLLIGVNYLLKFLLHGSGDDQGSVKYIDPRPIMSRMNVLPLIAILAVGAVTVNWFAFRGETPVQRTELAKLPHQLGDWQQKGSEIRFDAAVEAVLRTTDHTMREYTAPDGRLANIYVGYYASQRTGATYHSPQNCLPGAGWVMTDHQTINITTTSGRQFTANLYTVENGPYRQALIYWYQGRGRIEASEYRDKLNTIWDSVTRGRSDGALVRVMTGIYDDEAAARLAAEDLAAELADRLEEFVPE